MSPSEFKITPEAFNIILLACWFVSPACFPIAIAFVPWLVKPDNCPIAIAKSLWAALLPIATALCPCVKVPALCPIEIDCVPWLVCPAVFPIAIASSCWLVKPAFVPILTLSIDILLFKVVILVFKPENRVEFWLTSLVVLL